MIRLTRSRTPSSVPVDFVGARLVRKHEDLIKRYYDARESGEPIEFTSSKWKSAKSRLKRDSSDKCAYCEAPTASVAHGDVEHFRPKNIYWWLAYNFDNYVFACQICNQLHKGVQFPISGIRRLRRPAMPAARPNDGTVKRLASAISKDPSTTDDASVLRAWSAERADLVHPYLDDPEKYLNYRADPTNREVWITPAGGPNARRIANACIVVLGLNREELRRLRYIHYETLDTLRACYGEPLPDNVRTRIENDIRRSLLADFPFAGMNRFFVRQWGMNL